MCQHFTVKMLEKEKNIDVLGKVIEKCIYHIQPLKE